MQKYAMLKILNQSSLGTLMKARWKRGKKKLPRERMQFVGKPPPLYACLPDIPHRAYSLKIHLNSIRLKRWSNFNGLPKLDPNELRWGSPRTHGRALKRRKICTTVFTYLPQLYGRPDDNTRPYLILRDF